MIRCILPFALLAGCATVAHHDGPDPKLTAALDGKTAGKPQSCIRLDQATGSEIFRDSILYREGRNRYWLADAPGCGTLGSNDYILVQNVFGSELCRGDIVRLVDRSGGFHAGSCAIRGFTPYTRPKG
jgi:hypothetical protein